VMACGRAEVYVQSYLNYTVGGSALLALLPSCFTPEERRDCSLFIRRLCGNQSQNGRFGEDKKCILLLPRIEHRFFRRPTLNTDSIRTDLPKE
jgi:hypothetical protein